MTISLLPAMIGFVAIGFCGIILYLWHINNSMLSIPEEADKASPKRWSKEEICGAYKKAQDSPTDVSSYLPAKKGRRYVVVGGSGLVGGWIVQHLLMRGEDPSAIRILDLKNPTRPEVAGTGVDFVQTDVSDSASVSTGFNATWKNLEVSKLPLTVFHTVAYIHPAERKREFLTVYEKININGTRHVLDAAKKAGASCLIATSSGSIGIDPPQYFTFPWQHYPQGWCQVLVNGEPKTPDGPLESFGSCYAYTKAQAEKMVREADDKIAGFRTGCIRPAHAIYGHGVENPSSITYDYLRRGGAPSWIYPVVSNFVNAQNVSIGHLAYEDTLLNESKQDVGGRAYCCTDPNDPIQYCDLYRLLETLAHPKTPAQFFPVPPVILLVLAYIIEAYNLLRYHYLEFLPAVTGDVGTLMPAMFQMCTLHLLFDDSLAKKEIGYKPALTTLEGMCLQLVDWNAKVEKRLQEQFRTGKGVEIIQNDAKMIPKSPDAF